MENLRNIRSDKAMKVVGHVMSIAKEEKLDIAVAISDSYGELVSFCRTDECCLASVKVAIAKSFSAARLRQSTRDYLNSGFPPADLADGGYTSYPGGFPLLSGNRVVGGIGISGLTPEEDEALARRAIAFILKE